MKLHKNQNETKSKLVQKINRYEIEAGREYEMGANDEGNMDPQSDIVFIGMKRLKKDNQC